jgi:hypothetical protein
MIPALSNPGKTWGAFICFRLFCWHGLELEPTILNLSSRFKEIVIALNIMKGVLLCIGLISFEPHPTRHVM